MLKTLADAADALVESNRTPTIAQIEAACPVPAKLAIFTRLVRAAQMDRRVFGGAK